MTEPDRRVRRTRRILKQALISLVLDKDYEQITVQDILDRADIGRSTFYAHYRDKEALLVANFDEIRAQLEHEIATGSASEPARPAMVIYQHTYRHQQVYRALCGKQGGHLVHRHLHGLIGDLLHEQLSRQRRAESEPPLELAVEFHTSAALGLLTWWIDHDFTHDAAWLTRAYRQLAQK